MFSSRSLEGQVKNSCPAHIFLIVKYKEHILHTEIYSEMLNVHTSPTEFEPEIFGKSNVTEGKVQNNGNMIWVSQFRYSGIYMPKKDLF